MQAVETPALLSLVGAAQAVRAGHPESLGTRELLAAAFMLNRADLITAAGYTLAGALLEVGLVNLTFIPIAAERMNATPC